VPDQPVEDGRRAVRPSAHRAGRATPALSDRPKLFVVTGPSGAGKGTLIKALLEHRTDLELAVSATTRPRREGEVDGVHYHFISDEEFLQRVGRSEFLEHVVYVSGERYGTLRSEIERIHGDGKSCVLELETRGARAVRDAMPDAVTIFISPPSFAELERRLRERATESSGEIGERLELARAQMGEAGDFDYNVVNDDVARAVTELDEIVTKELNAVGTLRPR
jgi:guanylate kinase